MEQSMNRADSVWARSSARSGVHWWREITRMEGASR